MLRNNLEALARRDPELLERIRWPVESDHVVFDQSGQVHYRLNQGRYLLSLAAEDVERGLGRLPEDGDLFVFGVGLGEQVEALLALRPRARVIAWDRDPWLLRLALAQNDWSRAIDAGALRLLMGSDVVETFPTAGADPARVLLHPFLALVYGNERILAQEGLRGRPVALICPGGLFVEDLSTALRDEGFALYTFDILRLSTEELARTVRRLTPAVIGAINYTEGLAEFVAAQAAALGPGRAPRLLCWEIDPATSALPRCTAPSDDTFVFSYRRQNVGEYRAAGFRNVEYLPLAADPVRRTPALLSAEERDRYAAPVSFVGSSMVPQVEGFREAFVTELLAARPRMTRAEALALLEQLLADQRMDFSRYALPEILSHRRPDIASAPGELPARLTRLAAEIAAAEKRLSTVSRLARFGMQVWGDEGWRAVEASGVRYRGPAGHAFELNKVYSASQINVDIGRLYQGDIVTMRVFDALACGAFVLCERSEPLGELFAIGEEVDCYASLPELEDKVAFYLSHPDTARALAERGQAAVRTRHTIGQRVRAMLVRAGVQGRTAAR